MTDQNPAPVAPRVVVRGIPAPGFNHWHCAKRKWGKNPVVVYIVDDVTDPKTQITPADYKMLTDPGVSQHISVVPYGADDSAETVAMMSQLSAKDVEIDKLRKELSEAAEMYSRDREIANRLAAETGGKVIALTAEVEQLRADLRRMSEKRKA